MTQSIDNKQDLIDLMAIPGAAGKWMLDYVLTENLDMAGLTCSPIGTVDIPFSGSFDGDGHTISNLTISETSNSVGLFGQNNGTILNCGVSGSVTSTGNSVGGIKF